MRTSGPSPEPRSSRGVLAEFQRALAQAVMRPLDARENMRLDNREVATAIVKPNERLSAFDRLQIYNQQYWWRLLGAFAEDFRGLRAVLGERKFDRLAVEYLEGCGSTTWNLRDLGQHLERFLEEHPDLAAPYGALALDMARVEWARVIAFDGEQKPRLETQNLAGRAPSRIRLGLQPYLTLLELKHPIDDLLRRLKRRETASASNAVSGSGRARRVRLAARPAAQPIYLAVHRLDFSVYYKRLDPPAYRILSTLRAGSTLGTACAEAFRDTRDSSDKNGECLQTWFAAWMQFGWLCER